jgi:AcrR family transcriptional regulator
MAEPRVTLTRGDFLRSAFQIVDSAGLSALTMRALGDRMGVDPTAVYRHFPSRERLIDAMLDAVVQQAAESPNSGDNPRDRVMSVAVNIRRAFRSHPNVTGALATATGDFPSGFMITRMMISALRDLGLRDENLVRMYQTFEGYILGSCVFDTGGYPETFVIRQARYRLIGEPEFTEIATSPENVERVTENAYIDTINSLLDRCEHLVRH